MILFISTFSLCLLGLLIRNIQVMSFRRNILLNLKKAIESNRIAFQSGMVTGEVISGYLDQIDRATEAYDKVSYDEMVFKFWKPLKSFYKGTDIEAFI